MKLSIRHLGKTYQDGKEALQDFNWDLDYGVYGLLGPNGAGKSTLLEILSLNLIPSKGSIFWQGQDVQKHSKSFRKILGYLPQNYGFFGELNAVQLLSYLGRLHGLGGRRLRLRIEECLEQAHLSDVRKRKVKSYSGGMQQRLAIAQALLHSPQLVVIDEPTTGLDPGERVAFRNMLFDLGQESIVLISTHIVKDVEYACHQMTLLYHGTQRFTGQPVDFIQRVDGRVFEVSLALKDFEGFAKEHQVVAIHEHGTGMDVRFISAEAHPPVAHARPVKANLEDAYVDYIREQHGEEAILGEAV